MKKISIIIPVYNNFNLTINCINSILRHCKEIDYEIIVSDDCSSDDTKEFFMSQDEIIYRRNEENRGFAYTCNRGAEIAKGEYLLFLNNDTLLIDDILTKFLDTFQNFPEAGIVGCKLLYPDNTIQHGGIIIYPDKKLGHLFKNFPENYHSANIFRELQCVTGACFAIKRELFFDVGKFDENFINGFEDVDLCLRVGNSGYKVVYNPDISLFHFEEKTRKKIKCLSEDKNSFLITEKWLKKVSPDFFLLDEGYDFKLNDVGEFYIIKKDFSEIKGLNLNLAIEKEPLFFEGYKMLIKDMIDKENYSLAEKICKKLILFEPIIVNLEILKSIFNLKGDKESLKIIQNSIESLKNRKFEIKPVIEKIYLQLLARKKIKIANYYKEWLENYG